MRILFAPSEGKIMPSVEAFAPSECLKNLRVCFEEREKFVREYLGILTHGEDAEICKLFGVKNLKNSLDELGLCAHLLEAPTMQAIELYSGVAYKALGFASLQARAQEYVLKNLFIFSNLFGMVAASDALPFYKLNQNYKGKMLNLKALYKAMEGDLDAFFAKNDGGGVLDLRAEVYIKAYALKCPHIVADFLRGGKKVSHFAKHYRGVFVREMALRGVEDSAGIEALEMESMKLVDRREEGLCTRLVYEVLA